MIFRILIPGNPFFISSLVKGRKEVFCGKERVFAPIKNRIKQAIFLKQNCILMKNDKRYTWTVSVIAMIDKDEPENGPIMEDAYKEFEDSITSIKNANKDIKFVIYKYDVSSGTAIIRKSRINQNRYQLKTKEKKVVSIADFYTPPYQHLIDFFDEYVSKERLEDDEEHKHFLILWGHAAGFGFLKKNIEKRLKIAFTDESEFDDKKVSLIADRILSYNYVKSQLSLDIKEIPYELFLYDLSKDAGSLSIDAEQKKAISETIKLITAVEFAGIIEKGLSNDTVSVSTLKGELGKQKIQIMLCLSCYVNMIDTAYALKDLVNIYISPQTHISFFGYNYDQLFKFLAKHPDANEEDISINISHNYLLKYLKPSMKKHFTRDSNFLIYKIDYKDGVSFSANCLSKCDIIAEKIRNFKMIAESDPTFRDSLQDTRRRCFPLSNNGTQEIGILDYRNYMMEFFHSIFRIDTTLFDAFFIDDSYTEGYSITDHNPGILSQKDFIDGEFRIMSPGSFSVFLPNPTPADLEKVLMEIYFKQKSQFLLESKWDCIIKLVLETNTSFPLC
jgi:hypothetical protein